MQKIYFHAGSLLEKTLRTADQFAQTQWPVLLLGETGVGKELLARRVHEGSARLRGPFIPVNCGALPSGLVESELFGHVRGAFSGADSPSKGLVRQANGGTLFLDEVGELPKDLQVKLLRLLDLGEVRSVGSQAIDRVDVRIVAATHVHLGEAVLENRFRQDLFQRLSVLTLDIPPLRDRPEDITHLAQTWLSQWKASLEAGCLELLVGYRWPGNVRQLRNVLVRAQVLGQGHITRSILSTILQQEQLLHPPPGKFLQEATLAEVEREIILSRLRYCGGNRKETAKHLGIAKSTLHEKLRKWKRDSIDFAS